MSKNSEFNVIKNNGIHGYITMTLTDSERTWYCGYVTVNKNHPFYGKHHSVIIDQYPMLSEEIQPGLSLSGPTYEEHDWVFGFNTWCGDRDEKPMDINLEDAKGLTAKLMDLLTTVPFNNL